MKHMHQTVKSQSGAALVVGLILLVVLTLMALSSMNTASLDLIMAGNEQYRSRAFHAAEAGIEQAMDKGNFDTTIDDAGTAATGTGNDSYSYTITRPFNGAPQDPPPMTSTGLFKAVYFTVTSVGTSERNSTATNTQELFEVVQAPDEYTQNKGACAGTSDLDASASSC